eukprot:GHVT01004544.1.p1 GENE.GHVT01004544.1~~GHVT01004544.1.p1  ORF type:complete len:228 (-),score=56.42 GHVT01004544.1:699-1382(-)
MGCSSSKSLMSGAVSSPPITKLMIAARSASERAAAKVVQLKHGASSRGDDAISAMEASRSSPSPTPCPAVVQAEPAVGEEATEDALPQEKDESKVEEVSSAGSRGTAPDVHTATAGAEELQRESERISRRSLTITEELSTRSIQLAEEVTLETAIVSEVDDTTKPEAVQAALQETKPLLDDFVDQQAISESQDGSQEKKTESEEKKEQNENIREMQVRDFDALELMH